MSTPIAPDLDLCRIVGQFQADKALWQSGKLHPAPEILRRQKMMLEIARHARALAELVGNAVVVDFLFDPEVTNLRHPKLIVELSELAQSADWTARDLDAARKLYPRHFPSPETILIRAALELFDKRVAMALYDSSGYAAFVLSVARQAGATVSESSIRSERKRMKARVAINHPGRR
jgi:hypothetical protein